jgi:clan AA aspartic protease
MTGSVNAALEAMLPLEVMDAMGQRHSITVKVDTGYDGYLSLPPSQIVALRLPWVETVTGFGAGGGSYRIDVYEATILWDSQPRIVKVDAVNSAPLIGTAMLERHRVTIEMILGGMVTIDPLP